MSESKKLTIKQRWRKACTADNIVDFSVDVFLIVFDVLSSPILIVMRVVPVSYTHLTLPTTPYV